MMVRNVEDVQKFGEYSMDAAVNLLGAMSKSVQAIAIEAADYFKKSFEQVAATAENLVGAKSLDKAMEVQTEYVKNAYDGFVSQAAKFTELYADLAQVSCKPFEGYIAKVASTK